MVLPFLSAVRCRQPYGVVSPMMIGEKGKLGRCEPKRRAAAFPRLFVPINRLSIKPVALGYESTTSAECAAL
jgi:hypothetical protein